MNNLSIRCLAIDDEPLALLQLRTMIEKTPFLHLVAECADAFEAMKILNEQEVDAIFIDINMPDLNGLDFVRTLTDNPLVVFTTAYSQYAIDGFKVNATDYLLKPFGMPEFQKSAAKVKRQFELERAAFIEQHVSNGAIFVKADHRTLRIKIADIEYVEAQSEYLRLHMADGDKPTFMMSMKRMVEMLPEGDFIRIHRSYIVNMSKIKEIAKTRIKMADGSYLPISDMYKENIQKYINNRIISK